ncbi:MAG: hypothetical protein ABI440_13990 [Casimicrobiaceae bacterium]
MTCLLVKQSVWTLLIASMFALAAPSAHAIDVVVHASAFAKALKGQLFKDHGRFYLRRPDRCNDPYLESPTVSFRQGRVYVGAHFAGRIGMLIAGVCQSVAEPSAITLSARPVVRAQEVVLEDVRVEGAANPLVAAALENLIGAGSTAPLHINLLEAIRALMAPDKTGPYSIVVRALELSNLAVQSDELHVTVTGAIEVR